MRRKIGYVLIILSIPCIYAGSTERPAGIRVQFGDKIGYVSPEIYLEMMQKLATSYRINMAVAQKLASEVKHKNNAANLIVAVGIILPCIGILLIIFDIVSTRRALNASIATCNSEIPAKSEIVEVSTARERLLNYTKCGWNDDAETALSHLVHVLVSAGYDRKAVFVNSRAVE